MNWLILAFTSALLSAGAAIMQKRVLFNMDALTFSFTLAFLNMIFSLGFFAGADLSTVTFANLSILYFKTILASLAFWCVMLAIKNMEISGALPLMAVTPGLVAFFAWLLLGEALSGYEITGMLLLLAGTYILDMHYGKKLLDPFKIFIRSKSHHYILYALTLFTATSLLDKTLVTDLKLSPMTFMAFQQIFLFVNFVIIMLLLRREPLTEIKTIKKDIFLLIVIISFITIGYRYTQIEAVKLAPVALVLSVKRTSVFFAAVIGGRIFKEHYLLRKALATLIIITGAILIIYS